MFAFPFLLLILVVVCVFILNVLTKALEKYPYRNYLSNGMPVERSEAASDSNSGFFENSVHVKYHRAYELVEANYRRSLRK